MKEIREGLEADIDVSEYASQMYSVAEMARVKERLIKDSETPTVVDYTPEQTNEIILGIEAGVDTSRYDDPSLTVEEMREIRLSLEKELGK